MDDYIFLSDSLVFWTLQHTSPHSTPSDVSGEVPKVPDVFQACLGASDGWEQRRS